MATKNELEEIKSRLASLELKVVDLQNEVSQLSLASTFKPISAKPTLESKPLDTPPVTNAAPEKKKWFGSKDIETLFGGNLIGKAGFLAIILAFIWFLDYAFKNYWINESARICIGILSGFLFMLGGLYYARKDSERIPGAMLGTGASIIYVSIFAAYRFYSLIGFTETFVGLTLLSLATAFLSKVSKSEILYAFSFLGSILSPLLLSTGENSYRFFFSYLLIVNLLFLWISQSNPWKLSPFIVLIADVVIYDLWQYDKIAQSKFLFPFLFLIGILFIFLYREIIIMPQKRKTIVTSSVILLVISLLAISSNLGYLVDLFYNNLKGHALLFVSLSVFLFLYRFESNTIKSIDKGKSKLPLTPSLSVLALGIIVLALNFYLDGRALVVSYIVFASMLSITGSLRSKGLIVVSLFVWVLAVWILVFNEGKMEAPGVFILNTRFALFALATIGLSYTYLIRKKDPITNGLNLFLFAGLITIIVGTLFENYHLVSDSHYRNLGYSFVLTFYAIAFLVPGFVFSSPSFRKGGITVIIALILKLYLYDIWTMSLIVKIIAGFSFGTGLILTSIFYEKFKNKLLG